MTYPFIFSFVLLCVFSSAIKARQVDLPIRFNEEKLQYSFNKKGDRIPDFSYCGYRASEEAIPVIPTRVVVSPDGKDATAKIQAALDYVGQLPMDHNGFRGAVLLDKGVFKVEGQLLLNYSGVVLRGSGVGEEGTVLLGMGQTRETLIRILGKPDQIFGDTLFVEDDYVPVNGNSFDLTRGKSLTVGTDVVVVRPSTQEWIDELRMNEFGGETDWIGWKPGDHTVRWDRTITAAEDGKVTLNVPITTALDQHYGGGYVLPYEWKGRIENIGIENLVLRSSYDLENLKDEDHRWMGITLENVQDAWVRQVNFEHFAGSAVAVYKTGRRITVEDCKSLDPISEIGGERRNAFFTEGQQTLFQRCYSEFGYHDFSTGLAVAGPNAFVQCEAYLPHSFSGGQQGWASGVLFDIVRIDGNALSFSNQGQEGRGAGWTAANSVFWQCDAAKIENYQPPTAQNWAFGAWAQFSGDGYWGSTNSHVKPRSLFYAQLEDRLGELPVEPFLMSIGSEPSSSPSKEQAQELTVLAGKGLITLNEWIHQAKQRNPIQLQNGRAKNIDQLSQVIAEKTDTENPPYKVKHENGLLLLDDKLLFGSRHQVQWWRGSLRSRDLASASPHITRFVPGRYGAGRTDNLEEVVGFMVDNGIIALDHNYGLWYERRRDDHERVRRMDGAVWPPFYELPFARSGKGTAWDGLSKYDLTKYNPWYWDRLGEFADLAEREGLILIHQNYFQHNILEAGAHWADFPWRPVNNINETGFPEPAPYAGDKRIFMDEQFYDINHPVRREVHRQYIRKCLDNFAKNSNVLQLTSAEYTGPLHFVEFWIDIIQEWEEETGKKALIGLSTTKDVQDAILADAERSKIIDVIDIRYWYPTDTGFYAPEGGKHLSPRQHARITKGGKETLKSVYNTVLDYRTRFPEKAVIHSTSSSSSLGWSVLFAGGSLPSIPKVTISGFQRSLGGMAPTTSSSSATWAMNNKQGDWLFYVKGDSFTAPENIGKGNYQVYLISAKNGELQTKYQGAELNKEIILPSHEDWVIWLERQ